MGRKKDVTLELAEVVRNVSPECWVRVYIHGLQKYFMGFCGTLEARNKFLRQVYLEGKPYPRVISIRHLDGFKHGLDLECI